MNLLKSEKSKKKMNKIETCGISRLTYIDWLEIFIWEVEWKIKYAMKELKHKIFKNENIQ